MIGRVLKGRYRIERALGRGGMGVVYEAVQLDLGRRVAIKTLRDVLDEDNLRRFRTEAVAAAGLAHPHIIQVFEFVPPNGDEPAYLVMELVLGQSLGQFIARRGALPLPLAVRIALQILDALDAAHGARILHRDIKPGNIIVLDGPDDDPAIKVVDFGLAKLLDDGSRHTATGHLVGTPAYMAREQLLGVRATEATDIYAVGVCLFEMLQGQRAYPGGGGELIAEVLRAATPHLRENARIPGALASIVERAMDRDAAKRFPSARAMMDALRARGVVKSAVALKSPVAVKSPVGASNGPPSALPSPRARWPLFVVLCAGSVLAGSGVLYVSRSRIGDRRSPVAVNDASPTDGASEPITEAPIAEATDTGVIEDAASEPETIVAPDRRVRAKAAPCVCVGTGTATGGILCLEQRSLCRCTSSHRDLCATPFTGERSCKQSVELEATKLRDGEPCFGFVANLVDGGVVNTKVEGSLSCTSACSDAYALAHARVAVPGTPCEGYFTNTKEPGIWRLRR